MHLFQKEIHDWNSWGAVYQSLDDFQKLIEEIFKRENLTGYERTSHLTPGTNAVFRAGNYVIKIFAPLESGAQPDDAYQAELQAMQVALGLGIRVPRLLADSDIQDKYLFRYMIMEYIEGQAAGHAFKSYTLAQKQKFVLVLKQNLQKMNGKPLDKVSQSVVKERAIHNVRWNSYPEIIKAQIAEMVTQYELSPCVYVHGDLTADNIILDKHNDMYMIDFADSTVAPAEYEYPPIVFDLFNYDIEFIHEFYKDMDYDDFIEKLFMGTLLHDFGASFIQITYEKLTGKPIRELQDINEVKMILHAKLKG